MRSFLTSLAVLLLLVTGCGSPEQQAVRASYISLVDGLEAGDYDAVFNLMSSNTKLFLDNLAEALNYYEIGMGANGKELLDNMMSEVDMSGLSRQVTSITVTGTTATVVTATEDGDETTTFVLENNEWKLDFEAFMKESINSGMAGSGMTVDGILDHEYPVGDEQGELVGGVDIDAGNGTCTIKICNQLGNWDIWYVYVSASDDSEWGDDWLGSTNVLSPGNTITIHVAPGTYDMMVEDEDGDTYSKYEVEVTSVAGYLWNVTLADMD